MPQSAIVEKILDVKALPELDNEGLTVVKDLQAELL